MYDLHAKSFKKYYSANKIDILYIFAMGLKGFT